MRVLPLVSAAACLVLAASARAATVAVAPLRADKQAEGEAVRKQVEHGLADNGLTVVSFPDLLKAAEAQGFAAGDLARPAVLMPVVKAAGAEAVVTGSINHSTLDIRVFNLDGVELWSRPIPLKKGRLAGDLPRKIARAVGAAIASGPANSEGPPVASGEAVGMTGAEDAGPGDDTAAEPDAGEAAPQPEEAPKHKPVATTKPKKDEVDVDGPPVETKPDTTPAPPYIDLGVGLTISFRNYKLCPGVSSCSQAGPNPTGNENVPISYNTTTPYGGFTIQAEGFPLPRLVQINDSLTFTAGLFGEFSQSLVLTNSYENPGGGAPGTFNSSEQRIEGGLTARLYFSVLGGTGYAGLNGAVERRAFNVGLNPLIPESIRLGGGFGVSAELPIASDFFKVNARFTYMPSMNPDVNDTTDYGQTGAGSGYDIRGGFSGGYGYFGYSALISYSAFSDVYTGAGEYTTNGAVAQESYLTIYLMVHGRF